MQLIKALPSHISQLMQWFLTEQQLVEWAGPNFRFPYDLTSFSEDLNCDIYSSYVLLSIDNDEMLAFGQYYKRLDKCHLARLIVNPQCRNKGLSKHLIHMLSNLGQQALNVNACSLFVFSDNQPAVASYKKNGFRVSSYPQSLSLDNCLYMTKENNDEK